MAKHDQRFKTLLREFLREFFLLFFPAWAERFDFAKVEWQDKEIFPDPPQGETYEADLLAKLPVRKGIPLTKGEPDHWLALVHIEVESPDKVAPLRPRMFHYYENLRRLFALPVLPIGLYLRVGLDGVGWDVYEESFWEEQLLRFRYAYIGLPALDAESYVQGDNWLGVALSVLMRVPSERRLELAEQAWRRLVQSGENDFRRRLLCECVEAYAPLEEGQRRSFLNQLIHDPDPGVQVMAGSVYEMMQEDGQRKMLRRQLEVRFGPLHEAVLARLAALTTEQLDALSVAILTGTSLKDLGLAD